MTTLRRFSAVELVVSLLALVVIAPFVDQFKHGEFVITCLMVLVLVAAVLCVGARRWTLVVAALLAVQLVVARTVSYFWPQNLPVAVTYLAALAFCAFVVCQLLRFVMAAPRVTTEVLCAGVAAYMLTGLGWSAAYLLESQVRPDAFAFSNVRDSGHVMGNFEAFYFSLITLTTVGYGDITPVSRVARMLAATEAMVGVLYIAILIARLVSLYASGSEAEEDRGP